MGYFETKIKFPFTDKQLLLQVNALSQSMKSFNKKGNHR